MAGARLRQPEQGAVDPKRYDPRCVPTAKFELNWVHDGKREHRLLESGEVRLGRAGDNEVVLPDFSVSRRHAVLRPENEGWTIEDLGSTNGIQVNGIPVRRAVLRAGDRIKIGIFELDLTEAEALRSPGLADAPTAVQGVPLGTGTIVRSLKDFSAEYGLEGIPLRPPSKDKREALDEAYANRIFGFMTRLARLLLRADSVDEVLEKVLDIAFEALPVDRGFILLTQEGSSQAVCEIARVGERVEFRPQSEVPVSRTMVDQVVRERVALLTYDALADRRLTGGESIRIHQIRSAMCAPLWSGEQIIGVLQVDTPFHVGTFTEKDLDLLTALANYAAVAVERLRNARIAEFERQVRSRLERYHSPAVIESIVQQAPPSAGETSMGRVRQADATVLFADLAGFTALAEKLTPAEVAELLEGYFTHAVEAIFAEGGTLDKFIGDCVMAFFGAPVEQPDHALRAVRAAIEIQRSQRLWNEERSSRGLPTLQVRIAINSGPVVVGDVGSNRRVDYTVLGNTVNVAARIEAYVADPGEIVVGPETARLLGGAIELEAMGEWELKGLQQKILPYRVAAHLLEPA